MSTPYFRDESVTLWHGDSLKVLRTLPDQSVDCCVTSPPYFGLRDYGTEGQYGLEASPAEYVETMRALFAEVRRVLTDDGTLWLNIGDSYANTGGSGSPSSSSTLWGNGHRGGGAKMHAPAADTPRRNDGLPSKNLLMIPARTAIALQEDGWILRNDIVWSKPSGMPEAVQDRLSGKYEHVFMLTKSQRYWFDLDAIKEPASCDRPQRQRAEAIAKEHGLTAQHLAAIRAAGVTDTGKALTVTDGAGKNRPEVIALADEAKRVLGGYYREFLTADTRNPGDVWSIPMTPFPGAHFATMPITLAERAVLAGCKPGGTVLDPFSGSGTTGLAATKHGRKYVGIDLSSDYLDLSLRTRFAQPGLDLTGGVA